MAGVSGDPARVMLERDWLIGLVERSGRAPKVTDKGLYLPDSIGDFVYEADGHRLEVTIREIT